MVVLGSVAGKAAERHAACPLPQPGWQRAPRHTTTPASLFRQTQPLALAARPAHRWRCLQPTGFPAGPAGVLAVVSWVELLTRQSQLFL